MRTCALCNRELSTDDPLSLDCGGDCWGCIKQLEDRMFADWAKTMKEDEARELRQKRFDKPRKRVILSPKIDETHQSLTPKIKRITKMNSQFTVFKPGEVPLPKIERGFTKGPRGSKYPIDEDFVVGSAFLVPAEEGATKEDISKQAKSVQSSLNRLAKEYGYKLSVRALTADKSPWQDEDNNGLAGVGVWRVPGVYEYKTREQRSAEKAARDGG